MVFLVTTTSLSKSHMILLDNKKHISPLPPFRFCILVLSILHGPMQHPVVQVSWINQYNFYHPSLILGAGDLWPLANLTRVMWRHTMAKDQNQRQIQIQRPCQRHGIACKIVWNCWHFRKMRNWIYENHCDLKIKSQVSQVKNMQNTQKLSKVVEKLLKIAKKNKKKSTFSKLNQNCHNVGQVIFPHHSDQVSQSSQVSRVAPCMSKVKVPWVSEWVSDWVSDKVTYWAVMDS